MKLVFKNEVIDNVVIKEKVTAFELSEVITASIMEYISSNDNVKNLIYDNQYNSIRYNIVLTKISNSVNTPDNDSIGLDKIRQLSSNIKVYTELDSLFSFLKDLFDIDSIVIEVDYFYTSLINEKTKNVIKKMIENTSFNITFKV